MAAILIESEGSGDEGRHTQEKQWKIVCLYGKRFPRPSNKLHLNGNIYLDLWQIFQ